MKNLLVNSSLVEIKEKVFVKYERILAMEI
jgi:hypothetical protein